MYTCTGMFEVRHKRRVGMAGPKTFIGSVVWWLISLRRLRQSIINACMKPREAKETPFHVKSHHFTHIVRVK